MYLRPQVESKGNDDSGMIVETASRVRLPLAWNRHQVRQEVLAMPFQTASCVRHSDSRLLAVGESSSKDSGPSV